MFTRRRQEIRACDRGNATTAKVKLVKGTVSCIVFSCAPSKGKAAYVEDEETENSSNVGVPVEAAPSVSSPRTVAAGDDFEDFDDLEVLSADELESEDDGFLTDEEYDILDASDQETVASK